MKKSLFAVAVLAYTLLISMSGHSQVKPPEPVLKSFNEHFKNSRYSRWVEMKDVFVTTCSDDGTNWQDAYFTRDGEFKGVGKYISSDRLPRFVAQKIASYPDFELTELYQYECNENGICFIARIRNNKNELILKMNPFGDVSYSVRNKIKGAKEMSKDAIAKSNAKD